MAYEDRIETNLLQLFQKLQNGFLKFLLLFLRSLMLN